MCSIAVVPDCCCWQLLLLALVGDYYRWHSLLLAVLMLCQVVLVVVPVRCWWLRFLWLLSDVFLARCFGWGLLLRAVVVIGGCSCCGHCCSPLTLAAFVGCCCQRF